MQVNVTVKGGECPRMINLNGRLGWTVTQLAKAGPRGLTAYECPAPRWSSYVHDLRNLGIPIKTEMEPHQGPYSGRHARYRLSSSVTIELVNESGPQ